jgi:predicted DNA-binding transcriptional regulator AlpA
MTLQEIATLFGISRHTVMRRVKEKKLPVPVQYYPMSWNDRAIMQAYKRKQEETRHGRKPADVPDGRSQKARRSRLAKLQSIAARREA